MISSIYDIIFGIEIWIDNLCKKDLYIFLKGYIIFRNDRNFNGGGVFIVEKNNYIDIVILEL